MNSTNTARVTDKQIATLRQEAGRADDIVQIVLCDRALGEDLDVQDFAGGGHTDAEMDGIRDACALTIDEARMACAETIATAAAMDDSVDA